MSLTSKKEVKTSGDGKRAEKAFFGFNGKTVLKRFLVVMLLMSVCICSASAAGTIKVLDTFGDKLLDLVSSKWLKAILAIMLMVCVGAAAYGNSRGADEMVKTAIRWAVGTGVILAGTSVVNYFFGNIHQEALAVEETVRNIGICLG